MSLISKIKKMFKPKIVLNVNLSNIYHFEGVAVIFGGTSGIGLAIAKALSSSGATTVICGRNDPKVDGLIFVRYDLFDLHNLSKLINEIDSKYGTIKYLINSQGICPESDFKKQFLSITEKDFEDVFTINLESVFFLCQNICSYYIEKRIPGRILNIASTEGLKGGIVPYGLSKASVISFTKGLAKTMAKSGIVINGIAPGATATRMMGYVDDLTKDYIPNGRMCVPEEIAQLALFLLSDNGTQMPGQIVAMDGGESLNPR